MKLKTLRTIYLGMLAATMLVACSGEDTDDVVNQSVGKTSFELKSSVSSFVDEWPSGETRAWTPPSGYVTYDYISGQFVGLTDLSRSSIEVFFTQDISDPQQNTFFLNHADQWRLSTEITSAGDYYLYGFIPKDAATSASIAANGTYSNGAVLTINGLGTLSHHDVCVIVGAKDGTGPETVTGLATGQFKARMNLAENTHNYFFLLFDHIYTALRFRFIVDEEYDGLRTIKLRKLEMKAIGDESGTTVKSKYNAVVTLRQNTNNMSPIVGNIQFTADNSSADAAMEPIYDGEVTLSHTTPCDFMECFVPDYHGYFILRSTYDVYDKYGNLLRERCISENTINLFEIFGQHNMERGHIYSVTLLVKPTYLYMLSEPDLDNPTLTIGS